MLPVITKANRGKLITTTGFGSYDLCINPYVGCQFGCTYCYVRFFVKDKEQPWGGFVRTRDHIRDKFPKELHELRGNKLVIGTMTDPYQPAEKKHGLTRTVLEMINESEHKPTEIGIFTRSPLILQDLDLLYDLNVRVHVTITPFEPHVLKKIEPIAVRTESRFKLVKTLNDAGLKTHISVSPVLPIYSDGFVDEFATKIAETGTKGFTIDPMQVYGEAFRATSDALHDDQQWQEVAEIISDKKAYARWKDWYKSEWIKAWSPYINLPILPIGMDHESKTRFDLRNGNRIDFKEFQYP
jgi:DNA repair photolyase